jgi:Putative adhesin
MPQGRQTQMTPSPNRVGIAAVFLAVALAATGCGCGSQPTAEGSFDKTLTVTGPIRVELMNGGGDSRVTTGPAGEVRIHGEIQVRAWSEKAGQRRVDEVQAGPPVVQDGNVIRIGSSGSTKEISIDYTITVPADSEIRATTNSGDLEVSGLKGPANFTGGSGDLKISDISGDVQVTGGSGSIDLSQISGQVGANSGSGDITLDRIHDDIRLQTGSGSIEITDPAGKVEANTGSGDVTIRGATDDIRVRTSSGDVTVDGNPGPGSYWDFRTNNGDVELKVPSTASFRFYARSSSGDISAEVPVTMEGTTGKHEFQARIGDGKGRVEVKSSSGSISLK